MEVDRLRCFLAIVDEGGFGLAARRLHLSSSAVTRRVKELETYLQVQLFVRTPQSVRLTEAGSAMVEPCRDLLARFEALPSLASRVAEDRDGVVRVGVSSFLPPSLSGELVGTVLLHSGASGRGHGRVVPVVETSDVLAGQLCLGELDVAVMALPPPRPGLVGTALAVLRLQVAMRADHPLAGRRSLSFPDLSGNTVFVAPRSAHPSVMDATVKELRSLGINAVAAPTPDYQQVVHLVELGQALAVVPHADYGGPARLVGDGCRLVDVQGWPSQAPTGLVWRESSPAAEWAPDLVEPLRQVLLGAGLLLPPSGAPLK